MRRFAALMFVVAVLGAVPASAGHASSCSEPGGATIAGVFDAELEGDWVMVPFGPVPEGCHRLEVSLTHDQVPHPGTPVPGVPIEHTLDLAVYEPTGAGDLWGREEFRGYGGSGETDVVLTEGANTTKGFTPGPIPAGTWAAELGVASIASVTEGDDDGRVEWTIEITWSDDADPDPWITAPYPTGAVAGGDWYEGDFHVHGPHSNDAHDMSWDDLFDAAFAESGLDFIAVSDHNVTRQWAEIGAQDVPDGKLVLRSEEVTTYLGHVNSQAAPRWIDYRTGRIWQWDDGPDTVAELRDPIAPGDEGGIFDQVHDAGGWTQVNHPTTFPSPVPGVGNLCRGCPWEYSDEETEWSKVDAMEVATGPGGTGESTSPVPLPEGVPGDGTLGPNPFTPLAIEWFDRLQRRGFDITAVGSSDSHRLNEHELTHSPIGEATTVVRAPELSEDGIRAAIDAGHAYVKMFGAHGPDLRFEATPLTDAGTEAAIMGDDLEALGARFRAQVVGPPSAPGTMTLHVFLDGAPTYAFPVPNLGEGDVFDVEFVGLTPGDYRLQLMRGTAIEAITNPIDLDIGVPGLGKLNRARGLPGRLRGR